MWRETLEGDLAVTLSSTLHDVHDVAEWLQELAWKLLRNGTCSSIVVFREIGYQ